MLHVLAVAQVLVHVSLDLRQVAANDLHQLGRQVLRVESVDAPQDEVVHRRTHLHLLVEHLLLLLIRRVRLAAAQDVREGVAPELLLRAQNARVGEVDHRVKLLEIVLHRRSRQEHAPLDGEAVQRPGRLVLPILQPVGLVAHQQIAAVLVLREPPHVRPNRLVAGDQHVEHLRLDEAVEVLFHRLAVRLGQREGLDGARAQPLGEFVVPVLDEGAGADDDDALRGAGLVGRDARLEEGPDEADGLESLHREKERG